MSSAYGDWSVEGSKDDLSGFMRLKGLIIDYIWVSDDAVHLRFDTNDGPKVFRAEAECCSHTWFSDIINGGAMQGHVVLQVNPLELESGNKYDKRTEIEEDEGDSIAFYGVSFLCTGGTCDIIYRNASNGYYGGNSHGPLNQDDVIELEQRVQWKSINLDDWSADAS